MTRDTRRIPTNPILNPLTSGLSYARDEVGYYPYNQYKGLPPYAARAYNTSSPAMELAAGGWTQILLQTESYDQDEVFVSSTYIAPIPGLYPAKGRLTGLLNNSVQDFTCAIRVNGTAVCLGSQILVRGGSINDPMGSVIGDDLNLNALDQVTFWGFNNGGLGVVVIASGSDSTYLSIRGPS